MAIAEGPIPRRWLARDLVVWRAQLAEAWTDVAVESVSADESAADIGDRRELEAEVRLGHLRPDDVRVELLHGPVRADGVLDDAAVETLALQRSGRGTHVYAGAFDCTVSGGYGVAVRVVPHPEDLLGWADTGLVALG